MEAVRVSVLSDEESGSFVDLYPSWLPKERCEQLFGRLSDTVLPHMTHDVIRMYGKDHVSKRKVGTIATAPNVHYRYSSVDRETMELTFADLPWLEELRRELEGVCGHPLNFVFLNFYRPSTEDHPDDYLGFHSDDEVDMVRGASIVSLSVGDTRAFAFRKKKETKICCQTELNQGDVAIMRGQTQSHYEHSITKKGVKQSKRGRWNLTFRQFTAAPAACAEVTKKRKIATEGAEKESFQGANE